MASALIGRDGSDVAASMLSSLALQPFRGPISPALSVSGPTGESYRSSRGSSDSRTTMIGHMECMTMRTENFTIN